MKNFFETLEDKIYEAVEKDIEPILKEIGDERVYGVALVTDSDCITLYLALNTYEHLKKKDEEYIEKFGNFFSEEQIKMAREGSRCLTKWDEDEWGYTDGRNSELVKISELLYKQEESNPKEYEKYHQQFLEIVTSVLKKFVDKKIFGEASDEITYFVSMTDDKRTRDIENQSARLLNSESVYKTFLERKTVLE